MDTMFDKLGDYLREYIETGNAPKSHKKPIQTKESQDEIKKIPSHLINEFSIFGYKDNLPDYTEIKATYAKLIKELHPDTSKKNNTTIKLMEIQSAFEKIKKIYKK